MDPTKVLKVAYDLFLVSDIIDKRSNLDVELLQLLVENDYEIIAKTIIYILIYTVNNHLIYENIRQSYINDAIDLLYIIDKIGFNHDRVIKKFVKLIYQFFSYSLQNKVEFIANKEKRELVKSKLDELVNIIRY